MRFIIAFDTMYGNTRKVAEYVTSELIKHGHETELVDLKRTKAWEVRGDVLLLGSPTRMGKMSRRAARFAKKIDHEVWKDRPMAVFDTILELPQDQEGRAKVMSWTEKGAATWLMELLTSRGFKVHETALRVEVIGIRGPLAIGAEETSRAWARDLLAALHV
jgi:menaquinone-dependent protoporphyrinogen IX oxidase